MEECLFCNIAQKKVKSYILDENENFIAFLSIYPNTYGATVVIPKHHYDSYIFDLDDDMINQLMKFSKHIAKILDHSFEDVGRTAIVFEGFGVNHVHAKLFPMHGTKDKIKHWQPIKSNINHFFEKYEGYISSHDSTHMSEADLENIYKKIKQSANLY